MSVIDTLVASVTGFLPAFFDTAFAVIAAASAIAALTPTPADDRMVSRIYRVIDVLALNVGYAKEKPQKGGRFVPR